MLNTKNLCSLLDYFVTIVSLIIIVILSPTPTLAAECCLTSADCTFQSGGTCTLTPVMNACPIGYKECSYPAVQPPVNNLDNPRFSDFAPEFNTDAIGLDPKLVTIGGIISVLLPWLMIIAGLTLFTMLISGGFILMTTGNNPDNAEKGKTRLTAAILGFIIIFSSYWIIQIMEIILGITILGN